MSDAINYEAIRSRNNNLYVFSNWSTTEDTTEVTDVEKRLERVARRLKVTKKHLAERTTLADKAFVKLEKARKDLQVAQAEYDNFTDHNTAYIHWHQRKIEELTKEQAVYRLMNDIRLGKILPVVAETGNIANVTFS